MKTKTTTLSSALTMAFAAVVACMMFVSCSSDPEEREVSYTLGDITSNAAGVTTIGQSSYTIHYEGELDYDAGFLLSTSSDFNQNNTLLLKMTSSKHKASNHESSTGTKWDNIKFTHTFPTGTTVYYTVYVKFYDETEYRHGPVKTFVAQGNEN